MQRAALLLLIPALYLSGCKTTSKAKEFQTTSGDAHQLIVGIVHKAYPNQFTQDGAVIDQFADGLIKGNVDEAKGSDKVLQNYYDAKQDNELEVYVVGMFAGLTNLTDVLATPGTQLTYKGATLPQTVLNKSGKAVN